MLLPFSPNPKRRQNQKPVGIEVSVRSLSPWFTDNVGKQLGLASMDVELILGLKWQHAHHKTFVIYNQHLSFSIGKFLTPLTKKKGVQNQNGY